MEHMVIRALETLNDNVGARLVEVSNRQPNKPALILPQSTKRIYTYGELHEASQSLAKGLVPSGIQRGTRVALMATPSFEFFALCFALVQVGAVIVIVDPGIGLRNVTRCLAECAPEVYVGTPLSQMLRHLFGWGKHSVKLTITIGSEHLPMRQTWGGISLDDIRRAGKSASENVAPDLDLEELAAIIYSSGSTGLPKGACYTHGNFIAQIEMLTNTFELDGNDIDLPAFPLFALIDFLVGVTAVIPDLRFPRPGDIDPVLYVDTINDYGVTNMFGSPVVLEKLVQYATTSEVYLPTLKRVITAGAPASPEVLERFQALLPPDASIYGIYGATESLPIACINSCVILEQTRTLTAQGAGVCIGKPVIDAEVRIMTIGDTPIPIWSESLRMPEGIVGEIVVKGAAVTASYVGRDDLNAFAKIRDDDGSILHRTGDLGFLDIEGRLWYCGRKSHRVETSEGILFTEQVEGIFNTHPMVKRSALVSVSHNRPVICIELEQGVTIDSEIIRTELLDIACQHSLTCAISTVLFHRKFPVDVRHNSKIIREKLALWAQQKLSE